MFDWIATLATSRKRDVGNDERIRLHITWRCNVILLQPLAINTRLRNMFQKHIPQPLFTLIEFLDCNASLARRGNDGTITASLERLGLGLVPGCRAFRGLQLPLYIVKSQSLLLQFR